MYKNKEKKDVFPNFFVNHGNEESTELRNEGNVAMKKKEYYDALVLYNRSLCVAENRSSNLGLAYANRAQVYLELKLYEQCLVNLRLARENKYPVNKLGKLNQRETKCLEFKELRDKTEKKLTEVHKQILEDFIKLSHEPNKKLPFMTSCLEMKNDIKYGTKIITNKPLAVGDIIAIEDPFSASIGIDSRYQQCANCFKQNFLNLKPCYGCMSTMYCSEECKTMDFQKYHKFMCDRADKSTAIHSFMWTAPIFKQITEAFHKLNRNAAGLEDFSYRCDESPVNLFDFDLSQNSQMDTNKHKKMIAIANNLKPKMPRKLSFEEKITSFELHINLYPGLAQVFCCIDCKNFGHRIFAKLSENIYIKDDNQELNEYWNWFSGVYFLRAYMNHSCVPNVSNFIADGGKMLYIVQAPIAAGGQLFVDHAEKLTSLPIPERQVKMLREFNFKCSCEACSNYPSKSDRECQVVDKDKENDSEQQLTIARDLNVAISIGKYRDNCRFIQDHFSAVPCKVIDNLRKANGIYLKNIVLSDVWRQD